MGVQKIVDANPIRNFNGVIYKPGSESVDRINDDTPTQGVTAFNTRLSGRMDDYTYYKAPDSLPVPNDITGVFTSGDNIPVGNFVIINWSHDSTFTDHIDIIIDGVTTELAASETSHFVQVTSGFHSVTIIPYNADGVAGNGGMTSYNGV